ncbi:MAG: SMI1/KNR4 family protein [Oscillatoriaceae cyanobacterium Prado104]|jgi:hypothetical protein|nr:SMI1/KNR4 family protein [Oscillatoriaceae cyanobacterium Prado104]
MINQWRQLLATLEVTEDDSGLEILSEDELTAFEIQNNITLPTDYKEFCQILGTGCLWDLVLIFCPSNYLLETQKDMIGAMIDQIRRYPSQDFNRDIEYINLLNSAFMFGEVGESRLIFWDLRTYSESDKSYDIYWADWETPECGERIFIGRNFFEFVRDFCYGTKSFDLIPELMEGLSPEDIEYTFSRFNSSIRMLDWDAICSREERSPDDWQGNNPA